MHQVAFRSFRTRESGKNVSVATRPSEDAAAGFPAHAVLDSGVLRVLVVIVIDQVSQLSGCCKGRCLPFGSGREGLVLVESIRDLSQRRGSRATGT